MSVTFPSRINVLNAIKAYLDGADIPYLSRVYPYPAKFTPEGDFYKGENPYGGPKGVQSGAIIWLFIEPQRARRIELRGAPPGGKMYNYPIAMDIVFRSVKARSQDAGIEYNTFLDALINAIEADKNAGTTDGTIFSWGEGGINGGDDLELVSSYPQLLEGAQAGTQHTAKLTVTVQQQTTGTT